MARIGKPKNPRHRSSVARPGAARALPAQLISRVPVLRRLVPAAPEPPRKPSRIARLLPARLASLLPVAAPAPAPREIPIVSPVLRRVRKPVARTAAVMQLAREVSRPRSRWQRLRDAARATAEEPLRAAQWQHWMGVGLSLAAPPRTPRASLLQALRGAPPEPPPALAQRVLRRWQGVLSAARKNAGPGTGRDRRGPSASSAKRKR